MKLHRLLPCIVLGFLAVACTTVDPTIVAGPRTTTDRFLLALADGYKAAGDTEAAENDAVGANLMYEKSAMAGRGQTVPVGDPMEWDARRGHPPMFGKSLTGGFANPANVKTALDYRARLVPWIEAMKSRDPVATAGQQVAFECWLEETSEDDTDNIAACGLNPNLWQIAAAPPPPAPAPAAMPPKTYLVFFDFDRSDISPEAAGIIKQAADDAKKGNIRLIVATGHADKAGSPAYNQRLSERRANAVKGALIREGIAPASIQASGRGESDPLVQTADGVREPRNRRVEIVFR